MTWSINKKFILAIPALAIFVLFIINQSMAQTPFFIVENISVDVTADDAIVARNIAYQNGMREALTVLVKRIIPRDYLEQLPDLNELDLDRLVFGIEVDNERTSNTRYLASLTISFSRDAIQNLLSRAEIPFTETAARPSLILPVYNIAGSKILWDEPNRWLNTWGFLVRGSDTLKPLIMPNGDLADIALIGAAQASRGDDLRIKAIADHYTVQDVLVAEANLRFEIGTRIPTIDVVLHSYGPDGEAITVSGFTGLEGESVEELLERAVKHIIVEMEENWKRETLIKFDTEGRLAISIQTENLLAWNRIRERLESSQAISSIEFVEISKNYILITINYFGDLAKLSTALAQKDLILNEEDGYWFLSLRKSL